MKATHTLPIIKNVTGYQQEAGLTTISFECDLLDGRGPLSRNFQINDYEMNWYYKKLGFDKRYIPFADFWQTAPESENLIFLFLLISDDAKSTVSMSAKAKVRAELDLYSNIRVMSDKYRKAS
jgi:hypothetical protein